METKSKELFHVFVSIVYMLLLGGCESMPTKRYVYSNNSEINEIDKKNCFNSYKNLDSITSYIEQVKNEGNTLRCNLFIDSLVGSSVVSIQINIYQEQVLFAPEMLCILDSTFQVLRCYKYYYSVVKDSIFNQEKNKLVNKRILDFEFNGLALNRAFECEIRIDFKHNMKTETYSEKQLYSPHPVFVDSPLRFH